MVHSASRFLSIKVSEEALEDRDLICTLAQNSEALPQSAWDLPPGTLVTALGLPQSWNSIPRAAFKFPCFSQVRASDYEMAERIPGLESKDHLMVFLFLKKE